MNRTIGLAGVVIALAVVDVGVRLARRADQPEDLPSLPGFDPAQVSELRIGRVDAPTVLRKTDGSWWVTAPIQAAADPTEVEAIVGRLAAGIRPELSLPPDPEGYGLAGGTELRVDVASVQGDLLSVVVGADAGGGGTYVRFANDETVYRAQIGGRSLYDRPVRTLLDRRIAICEPTAVSGVDLPGNGSARREPTGWSAGVDQWTVEALIRRLCGLRGAEVASADRVQDWLGTVVLHTPDPITLRFGRSGDLRYVERDQQVWRVSGDWVDRIFAPGAFADRSLWTASRVTRVTLSGAGRDGELALDGENWVVRRPANVDIDPARASAVVAWLRQPRVDAWTAGPFQVHESLLVEADGRTFRLEVGQTEADGTRVRFGNRIGRVDPAILRSITGIFGS